MARHVCYFDGRCSLCRRWAAWLRAADLADCLDLRDLTRVPPGELPVAPIHALRRMSLRTASGQVRLGFDALAWAMSRTVLSPLAWLLMLPGVRVVTAAAYDRLARARRRDPEPSPGDCPAVSARAPGPGRDCEGGSS